MLAGDQEAFRSLVEEYKDLVYTICFNVVRDSYEAENLTQETFFQVYKSLSSYKQQGFKSWLSKIALHKAIDFQRSSAHKLTKASIPLTAALEDRLVEEDNEAENLLIRTEEKNVLAECLLNIPPLYSNVLIKYYREDKSCKQIALEENISVRTVETRLYRGKKILRQYYEELSKT
ncbi:MAG: RNA polymerase sigma factor [Peptococcaceae bacterium]|nr:RNA polymerase sigma factor [Peptococcaceae bacterium]